MICYATKKGTAKSVAEHFSEVLHMPVLSLCDAKPADLQKFDKLVLVISNYGKGEGPKTCNNFFDEFKTIADPSYYKDIQFAVFGCGSTKRAPYYQVFSKYVEQKMVELGARKIHDLGERDDKNPDKSSVETWPLELHFD